MGVIKRQGIKHSIVRYVGIALGAINVIFLFPLFLGDEKLGLINLIVQTAFTIQSFSLLGITGVMIKFFPEFRDVDKKHNGLLTFSLLWAFAGFLFFLLVIWGTHTWIVDYYSQKSAEYLRYLPYVIPITFFLSFFTLLKMYAYNFKRIVVPTIFDQCYKIVVPVLAALFYFDLLPFEQLLQGVLLYFVSIFIGMLYYIYHLGEWKWTLDFSFFKMSLLKRILSYAGFAILSSLGSVLALRIDMIMVASIIDLSSTGIYTVAVFIASVIKVPGESIRSVASAIISEKIAENNLLEVKNIYRKSSIVLWTIGLFFLLNIWINIDSLFEIMPKGGTFGQGKYVILILGIGILFDLLTSVNGEIISYSPYYRFNFFAILFLGVINVFANLFFIPKYGIMGAALATASSLIIFNILKLVFIYLKYNVHPFSKEMLVVLGIAAIIYSVVSFFAFIENPYLAILIQSSLICILFIGAIFYFKISEDINNAILQVLQKAKSIFY